jgi:hypothetical protein
LLSNLYGIPYRLYDRMRVLSNLRL